MREIVLDTETTGMDPAEGDRLVEIGCVELENHLPTGKTFHTYLNPERDVPAGAVRVHGLTETFLKDKPLFIEKAAAFQDFISGAKLVIHNAEFDMKFLNAELKTAGFKELSMLNVVDTLAMARRKFPGQPASLDALCRRFKIDNTERTFHGALLDAQLLSEVYLELMGGRQHGLGLAREASAAGNVKLNARIKRQNRPHRSFPAAPEEAARHVEFLGMLKDSLWLKALTPGEAAPASDADEARESKKAS
jgi:DNA polymerase-3 subunit epsilon